MRAWLVHELGEPRDVLALAEVPEPEPGPGQVLVRVRAAAANFPDVLMCRGAHPDQHLPRPQLGLGDLSQSQHVARLAKLVYLPRPHSPASSIRCCMRFIPRSHLSVSSARIP